MDFIYVLPAAARIGFQESGETHIFENLVPIQRIHQVPHRLVRSSFGMRMMGEDHCRRYCNPQLRSQSIVEKLIIRCPPERVIDNDCSTKSSILEHGAIEGNVL